MIDHAAIHNLLKRNLYLTTIVERFIFWLF